MSIVALQQRYRGVIASVRQGEGYGFISIQSCLRANGDSHGLPTSENVFIHQDECADEIKVGMALAFEAVEDLKRQGCFRAQAATRWVEGEIVGGFRGSGVRHHQSAGWRAGSASGAKAPVALQSEEGRRGQGGKGC